MAMASKGVNSDCQIFELKVTTTDELIIRGSMDALYKSLSWIMRKVVNSVPDQTLQRIGKVISNAKKAKSIIIESALENPIATSILLFWILAAGLLLFLIAMNFMCRIFFAKKGRELSGMSMLWATLSFLVCVITSSIGMFIYSSSLYHIQAGIVMLPQQLNTTTSDVSVFISHINDSIACLYERENKTLHYKVNDLFKSIMINVEQFKNEHNVSGLKNVIDHIEQLNLDAEEINKNPFGVFEDVPYDIYISIEIIQNVAIYLRSIRATLIDFQLYVANTFSKIDESVKAIHNAKEIIFVEIADNMKTFHEVLHFVNRGTIKLQQQLADILNERGYSQNVHDILIYTLIVPFTLVFLSAIGLIGILLSWTFYCSRERPDTQQSRRGAFCVIMASTITTAGYAAMLVGAMLCVMAAFCFVIAFCAMFICMGFFEDDDLRLFYAIPNLGYTANFSGQKVHYTLYGTFYKCKNGYAFFDSLNGSNVMAAKQLRQGAVFRRHDIARLIRSFDVDVQVLHTIKSSLHTFRKSINEIPVIASEKISNDRYAKVVPIIYSFSKHFRDFIAELENAEKMLLVLHQSQNREQLYRIIKRNQRQLQRRILTAISTLFDAIVDMSPQCEHLMTIWNRLGKFACSWISAPTQGLHLACMICCIGSSAIYHSFFNTARFFYDFSNATRHHSRARRLRRFKCDYVKKKMNLDVDKMDADEVKDYKTDADDVKDSKTSKETATTTKCLEDSGESAKSSKSESRTWMVKGLRPSSRSEETMSTKMESTRIKEKQKPSSGRQ